MAWTETAHQTHNRYASRHLEEDTCTWKLVTLSINLLITFNVNAQDIADKRLSLLLMRLTHTTAQNGEGKSMQEL